MAEEARYGIKIDSNAAEVSSESVSALERYRSSIQASQDAIGGYSKALKALKGDSADLKAAQKELTDKINAERDAITKNSLALNKAGTNFDALSRATKKASDDFKKNEAAALKSTDELEKLAQAASDKRIKQAEADWKGFTQVLAIGTGIALATGAAIAKLGSFVFESANALRTQRLTREALVGNADDARRLGDQIEALGKKVPQSREELNQMANDLAQAGLQGKTLVDALNLVAQAQGAIGGSAASKLQGLVERGKLTKTFGLGAFDLQGTGLQFKDVAEALAKNTKVSVQEASQALIQGRVTLGSGAEALKDAVEKRFGKTNLAKLLDFDTLKTKAKDAFAFLTSGINLDPLLNTIKEIFGLFDSSSESGEDLKHLISFFGQGTIDQISKGGPAIKGFFELIEGKALDVEIAYLKLRIGFKQAFGKDIIADVNAFELAADAAKFSLEGINVTLYGLESNMRMITGEIEVAVDAFHKIEDAYDSIRGLDWLALGKSIVDGITSPITNIPNTVKDAGRSIVDSFKDVLGIHSPSTVIAKEVGKPMVAGALQPFADSDQRIDAAMSRFTDRMGAGASGGGASMPQVNVEVNYTGNASRDDVDNLKAQVKAGVVEALELALRSRGLATA